MLDHVSLPVKDLDLSTQFYDRILGAVGWTKAVERPGAVGYAPAGDLPPSFWILAGGKNSARAGRGLHVSFAAESTEAVRAFYKQALDAGARDAGEPGDRPEYASNYYGCFVIDPDGFKVEATHRSLTTG